MTDILIRIDGYTGHITLNRPNALNALTWNMCLAIETAIDNWRRLATAVIPIQVVGRDRHLGDATHRQSQFYFNGFYLRDFR